MLACARHPRLPGRRRPRALAAQSARWGARADTSRSHWVYVYALSNATGLQDPQRVARARPRRLRLRGHRAFDAGPTLETLAAATELFRSARSETYA